MVAESDMTAAAGDFEVEKVTLPRFFTGEAAFGKEGVVGSLDEQGGEFNNA